MKITTEQFLLNSVHTMKNNFPTIFDTIDSRRKSISKMWPDYVYFPRLEIWKAIQNKMSAMNMIQNMIGGDSYSQYLINTTNMCESAVAMYNWRHHKKIYKVSDDLTKLICNFADNTDLYSTYMPIKKFFNLDNNGIFVQARMSEKVYGFYVVLDNYENRDTIIFYFVDDRCNDEIYTKNVISSDPSEFVYINGKSIGECLDYTTSIVRDAHNKMSLSNYSDKVKDKFINKNIPKADRDQVRALAILSYILDFNSDVMENPAQAKIYKKPNDNYIIKDKFREIQTFDVGFEFTNTLNNIKKVLFNPNIIESSIADQSDNDKNAKSIMDMQQEINRLKRQIDELSSENISLNRSISSYDTKYKELEESIKSERQELYALRELVFNDKNIIEESTANTNISYPYILKHKTVIAGGTVSWCNAIRSKFNNIKVIDGLTTPNDDLIKYAEIIWIQVDCMKHKNYYKIMNIAKKYNIPVKYFTNKGIISCCNQLVESDIK